MAHEQQRKFCEYVKGKFPDKFYSEHILDVGSLDINGRNEHLFTDCKYTGLDICPGKNVIVVAPVHEFATWNNVYGFKVVISTEMLEHDKHWEESLQAMYKLTHDRDGLLLFTCATEGRPPHGVTNNRPEDSPLTNDYYRNLTEADIRSVLDVDKLFSSYEFQVNDQTHDLYFWGIKK